jgi:hypothetical protein
MSAPEKLRTWYAAGNRCRSRGGEQHWAATSENTGGPRCPNHGIATLIGNVSDPGRRSGQSLEDVGINRTRQPFGAVLPRKCRLQEGQYLEVAK